MNKKDKLSELKGRINIDFHSLKTKLMTIPVVLVILSIICMVVFSVMSTDSSMMEEKGRATELLLESIVYRMNDNNNSLESLEDIVDNTISNALEIIKDMNNTDLSTAYLEQLGNAMQVDEINLYQDGKITHSNLPINIDWVADSGHPTSVFAGTDEEIELGEIREDLDSDFDGLYKYGMVKNSDGSIFQLGIDVEDIANKMEEFKPQTFMDSLSDHPEIRYIGMMGSDSVYLSNSNKEYIGVDMSDDSGVLEASKSGEIYSMERELNGERLLDTTLPMYEDGELTGYLKVGMTLTNVNNALRKNIIGIGLIGLFVIALLVFMLYRSSNDIVTTVNSLVEDSDHMSTGDFSIDMPQVLQDRRDEFGYVARGNMAMKESIRNILESVISDAGNVAAYSQELTAAAQGSEMSAEELTVVIEEIANAATSQALEVENGFSAVQELGDAININYNNMLQLNTSTEEVNKLKDEGLELITDLVVKTKENMEASKEISEIIENTNDSADNIVNSVKMIRNIAEQTNLLSLNASIEAARAGDQGRGFAVVAEEIRKLAEESARFTEEIDEVVTGLKNRTLMAVSTMGEIEEVVQTQSDSVERTNGKFQGISVSIEDIDKAIVEVNKSNERINEEKEKLSLIIENLAAVAQENAAGTEESLASVEEQSSTMTQITKASQELANIAEGLNEATSVFRI